MYFFADGVHFSIYSENPRFVCLLCDMISLHIGNVVKVSPYLLGKFHEFPPFFGSFHGCGIPQMRAFLLNGTESAEERSALFGYITVYPALVKIYFQIIVTEISPDIDVEVLENS